MAEDMGERTEQPTARRRNEARRKGQVSRSPNFSAAVLLSGAILLIFLFGSAVLEGMGAVMRRMLDPESLATGLDGEDLSRHAVFSGLGALRVVAPILLIMFLLAIAEQLLQVGWFISTDTLKPRLSRFNPISGAKRLFSRRTAVKGLVDVLKLGVVTAIAWLVIRSDYSQIIALSGLSAVAGFVVMMEVLLDIALWALALLLTIGVIDWLFQRWQHTQDLRMTKQEVKDERKSTEGDLETKARRMRMARSILSQRLGIDVPKADVVVTNPTHYAVALKYDSATMSAPKVIAKGADHMAIQIRLIAAANGVPIVERPALARSLYAGVDVGREIPVEQYEAVAEVLAYIYRLEGRMAS